MTISTTKNNFWKFIRFPLVLIIFLCLWDVCALLVSNSYFLPGVKETGAALLKLVSSEGFVKLILNSLFRVAIGLIIGILSGILLATLCTVLPISEHLVAPAISVMKATPIATIILILWFTFTDFSLAIFVVILMVTPIIWQNCYDGFRSISKEMNEVYHL
jgi:NitT/TauT family transport system permease protein